VILNSISRFNAAFLLLATLALAAPAWAEVITGEVVAIADGDTLTLLTSAKQQIKIRLTEIDTPESRQPYGQKAKQALADLTFRKQVTADVESIDRYGRSWSSQEPPGSIAPTTVTRVCSR